MGSLYYDLKSKPMKEHREISAEEFDRMDRNMRYYDGKRYFKKVERALSDQEVQGRMLDAILEAQEGIQKELAFIKWSFIAISFLAFLTILFK